MSNIHPLLKERASIYGGSWKLVGRICLTIQDELSNLLNVFPEGWLPWIEILHKLFRILGSPRHLDSWRDIVGYATLVADHIEKENQNG